MEVSVIADSQSRLRTVDLTRFCSRSDKILFPAKVSFRQSRLETTARCFRLNAVRSLDRTVENPIPCSSSKLKRMKRTRLYVGLPLDCVLDGKTLNHAKAIAAGLKALKLLGIDGVELPIWWRVVENEAIGEYEWSGYLALAEMVRDMDLKLRISLCFHGSKQARIPLPGWVSRIGEADSSVFFSDKAGKFYNECLSFSVDDLPVLNGKTPLQVYKEFCESFKASFSNFLGSTITGISIGLGPEGEIRYPSGGVSGSGEFQCYDKNSLRLLKQHAEAIGNPLWGLAGPHDAPSYNESPVNNNFFKDGGSWETPYGRFFLSWYSNQLLSHLNRVLSIGSTVLGNSSMEIAGKVPLINSLYKTRSHASEVTAGFYNVDGRDGYEAVAEIFSRHSCEVVLSGMDRSGPESLIGQIKAGCARHGVGVLGQNSLISEPAVRLDRVRKNLEGEDGVECFVYHRMGASFFSPEHFPKFTEFVRSLSLPELDSDDLPVTGDDFVGCENLSMQVA